MFIDNSINEKYIRTLNLGCFPKTVLNFQDSQDYFQQLVFVDYQLQLLIRNEFNGEELTTVRDFVSTDNRNPPQQNPKEKLIQLINYTNSIHLNYQHHDNSRTYEEKLYYVNLMSHLLYLDGNFYEMHKLLKSITVSHQVNRATNLNVSANLLEFIQYLTCRYYTLLGLSNIDDGVSGTTKVWVEYLIHFNRPFSKSQVVANHWFDLMFNKLSYSLTQQSNGSIVPLSFINEVSNLPFFKNKLSIIAYSNYLLRPENSKFVNKNFKSDYSSFLTVDINECIHLKIQFPDASDENTRINDFINNLFESISYVPFNLAILKPSLSKQFLIDATTKTYQSRIVLSNLIYTLIDLNEYDEALAAFNTYITYSEKDQEQKNGYIEDILAIIDTYSTCIIHFNPLKSFKNVKKFHYSDVTIVSNNLDKYVKQLKVYLDTLGDFIDLTYDDENYAGDKNPLSFLYRKYNLNVLRSDHSQFIELISKAWHSIGYYHYYLSMCESPNQKLLDKHVLEVVKNYKNSLIINSTGNVLYLFSYALALSNTGELNPALKLCKFILKKYPESFKTWNLLVLLITSFNNDNDEVNKPAGAYDNILPDTLLSDEIKANGAANIDQQMDAYVPPIPKIREPEKFINKALNISGLYILKHQQKNIQLTPESKYEILQLKLTQMAVLESVHGTQYMIDLISEVFVLYHELFDIKFSSNENHASSKHCGLIEKWSHRPSFIDAKDNANQSVINTSLPPAMSMQQKVGKKETRTGTVLPPPSLLSKKDRDESKHELSSIRHNAVDKLKRLSKLPKKDTTFVSRKNSVTSNTSGKLNGVGSGGHILIKKPDFFKSGHSSTSPMPPEKPVAAQSVPQRALSVSSSASSKISTRAAAPTHTHDSIMERKVLQELWLWTASIFLKVGLFDECEQSIIEAELVYEPNVKTFIATGYLYSKQKKFLALQEFERSLEILDRNDPFNKVDYGFAILGLSKLILIDDKSTNSLFISTKDMDAAIIRLKNLLEHYSICWPYGVNNPEVWYYLGKIYETIDDKILLTKSLWKCIELEDLRPVRNFEICNSAI
ncbi:YPP1 [Candida oxycetoniae]|uniref:Cargo-transport protein YPP1 n=1 Tax=Candida oxycetoniae TaxID=497107 RepID=A0AAI9WWU6_9ASCO|nr:YPP1 [Candida oxycetoniae]KAI3403383.2 YPP1 [Candida oxycetoniae]